MTLLAERPPRQVMTSTPRPDLHLLSELRLAALPTAVTCAQLFATYTLRQWRLYELIAITEQLISELTANAVRTTGITDMHPRWVELRDLTLIVVRLRVIEQRLVIEVADNEPTFDAETAQGLPSVRSMSNRWSYYQPRSGGKVVWCAVDLPLLADALDDTLVIARPLPRRIPQSLPQPADPIAVMDDPGTLSRVRDGLRSLDDDSSGGSAMR